MAKSDWKSEVQNYIKKRQKTVNQALRQTAAKSKGHPKILREAMEYSLFSGGKRLRPLFVLSAAEAVGGNPGTVMEIACAIEFIHTYSLIHDDLPAMDDDDFRRGKPTCHRLFGEDLAILAGDALLTEAFRILTDSKTVKSSLSPESLLITIQEIARAAGFSGMVGGQVMDVRSTGKSLDLKKLEKLHRRKTGALFTVSLRSGGRMAGGTPKQLAALTAYGEGVGLAFQIVDDLLDRDDGSDNASYPSLLGTAASKKKAREETRKAIEALKIFGDQGRHLRLLARYLAERKS